jgi:hypothetical protein
VAGSLKDQLVGTWRLVSLETRRADGATTYPFGPDPIGLFVFDAQGNYSVQLTGSGQPAGGSGGSAGYVASLGTYEADDDQQQFTLTGTAGLAPGSVGVPTVRRVTMNGRVAVFQPPPQVIDGLSAQTLITWEKISG